MQNGKYSARADHRRHDRLLVTRFAMDDAYPGEHDEARQLMDSCADCAALAADIRVIASSMKQLPAPARQRDFTISEEQADHLRGSRLAQLLRGLATPGWATLRPVAGVALSIGLVMAVVGSVMPSYAPAAGSPETMATQRSQTSAAPAPQVGAPVQPPQPAASPAAAEYGRDGPQTDGLAPGAVAPLAQATEDATTRDLNMAYLEEASPETVVKADDSDDALALTQTAPADPTPNLLIYAGLAIALISLAVLLVAWSARRYFADPLLR